GRHPYRVAHGGRPDVRGRLPRPGRPPVGGPAHGHGGRRYGLTPHTPPPHFRQIRRSVMTATSSTTAAGSTRYSAVQPCLWFDDQAREAMEYYVSVFPDSRITSITEYPDESLDPHFHGMT